MNIETGVFLVRTLTHFIPAVQSQGEEKSALDEITPESVSEAAETVAGSLGEIWGNFLAHMPYVIGSLMVLFVTFAVVFLLRHFGSHLFRRTTTRKSLQDLLVRLMTIAAWLLGLLLAAMVLSPELTPGKMLGAVGLLSVAIGFAFKDIFENFFAGILILWNFPFEEGDVIECEDLVGRVESVEVRNTTIRRMTGELVVVPNLFLFKNPCHILTNRVKRRVTITAGIAYHEDVSRAVEIIRDAVAACKTVRDEEPVQVFPEGFGSSSIDIEVTWWTGSTPFAIRESRGEVVTAIKRALDDAGVEIPFPHRTLLFKEALKLEGSRDGGGANGD